MNEHIGSNAERRVRHRRRRSPYITFNRNAAASANRQLRLALLVTLVSVGTLLGSFLLSQLDRTGGPASPTQAIAQLPLLTPFLPTFTPLPSATRPGAETPLPTTPEEGMTVTAMLERETAVAATRERETAVAAAPGTAVATLVKLPMAPIQSPTPPLLCTRPPGWIIYTVRVGDTLATLAARAGVTTRDLMQANCLSTYALVSGQHIYLPASFYPSPTPEPEPCGPPWGWEVYIVRSGDTLYSLSRRFGVSVEQIRFANCLASYTIYRGQALFLPPLPPTPRPPATPTATPSPSATPTRFPSATPTPSTSPTLWPTFTPTGTPRPSTPTPTTPATQAPSATATQTPTPTYFPTPTSTVTYTPVPVATSTPTPTPTSPPAPTSTPTQAATPSPTPTTAPGSTQSPTSTPPPTEPSTSTPTPSPTAGG